MDAAGAVLGQCSEVLKLAQRLLCDFNRLLLPEDMLISQILLDDPISPCEDVRLRVSPLPDTPCCFQMFRG